jgi:hypothetical protein
MMTGSSIVRHKRTAVCKQMVNREGLCLSGRMWNLFLGSLVATTLAVSAANAQWWNPFAPKDWEDCVAQASKSGDSDLAIRLLIRNCDSQFKGRRKPGGGYYVHVYDDDARHGVDCDIAGPNPTPAERTRCKALVRQEASEIKLREKERTRLDREAARQVYTQDGSIKCATSDCWLKVGTVTIVNGSDRAISEVAIGWVFLPSTSRTCPSKYSVKESYSVYLGPGDTTAVNFKALGETEGEFTYCIGVSWVRFAD